jgi:starch synthase
MRQALSVTSECVPFVKTGGLADVAGALPDALAGQGWEVRTMLPGYRQVMAALKRPKTVLREDDLFGGPARLLSAKVAGQRILVIDAPHLFDRPGGPYLDENGADWPDNAERFAALGWMAARVAADEIDGFAPEVLHVHDWQGGLAPVYLAEMGARDRVGSVLTIHNIAFHGLAPASMRERLRLPASGFTQEGFEFWGQINALKAGIVWADRIVTVSPTYADELKTPEFGWGLDGILRMRGADFDGILNGIDEAAWDPATDPEIDTFSTPAGKRKAKARLRAEFGLPDSDGPLAVVVSRLSEQKGLDLLLEALPALIDRGGQLVLLGSGDRRLEFEWQRAAQNPHVAVHIGYDETMSHRIIAGGDAILVPSRFEPCGLTQMYGLRYGTVPVVSRTGGLADTVIDASPVALRSGVATGIQFHPVTAHALAAALIRLVSLYRQPKVWVQMQKNGMRQALGWDLAAAEYAALYAEVSRR